MAFQRFLNTFDSPGGHLLMLALGILLGCGLMVLGFPDGHTIAIGAGSTLLLRLKSSN